MVDHGRNQAEVNFTAVKFVWNRIGKIKRGISIFVTFHDCLKYSEMLIFLLKRIEILFIQSYWIICTEFKKCIKKIFGVGHFFEEMFGSYENMQF